MECAAKSADYGRVVKLANFAAELGDAITKFEDANLPENDTVKLAYTE